MRDPADTRRWINVCLTLVHCLLRWTNVKPTLLKRLVFAGEGFDEDRCWIQKSFGEIADCRQKKALFSTKSGAPLFPDPGPTPWGWVHQLVVRLVVPVLSGSRGSGPPGRAASPLWSVSNAICGREVVLKVSRGVTGQWQMAGWVSLTTPPQVQQTRNIGPMLGRRRRRRANIGSMSRVCWEVQSPCTQKNIMPLWLDVKPASKTLAWMWAALELDVSIIMLEIVFILSNKKIIRQVF